MEGLTPRGYQLEMIRLSLENNVVVAIPTGGGKTLIAAKSIQAELERSVEGKRVWFLCPTVVLVYQQHGVLRRELPQCYELLTLTGDDNVDRWGSQSTWNRVLHNISVVICTYQVLKDALESGFVRLKEISLLVFDEAHVCNKLHPGNRIMQGFYHPAKREEGELPRVLGLTASLIGSDVNSLEMIETNLDAIGRTPKLSHDELLRHVHLPSLVPLVYPLPTDPPPVLLEQLNRVRLRLIDGGEADPYVVHLRSHPAGLEDIAIATKLDKALEKGKTWCIEQAKRLWAVAQETHEELGYWSLYAYLTKCLEKIAQLDLNDTLEVDSIRRKEISYFSKAFGAIDVRVDVPMLSQTAHHSPKVNLLVNALVDEMQPGVTGILFVKTRAAVKLLSELLSTHPATRDILRIGTFVGASSNQKGTQHISELIDGRGQAKTLDELRSGKKNLVIATSVVEEGIDISACNFVMCFDPPNNLRQFIQRRGRARKEQSKYIIMFSEKGKNKIKNWQIEEENMKKMYQDDMRQLHEQEKLESEDTGHREFVVESTGAKLTLHDSVTRLHHFCDRIPADGYSSREPIYVYTAPPGTDRVKCEVHLPNGVHDSIRCHVSLECWRSERLARMDAAFEAVVALYKAELIDDHLVPLNCAQSQDLADTTIIEKGANILEVDEQLDLWPDIARRWNDTGARYTCVLTIQKPHGLPEQVELISSRPILSCQDLNLHIARDSTTQLRFQVGETNFSGVDFSTANRITRLILRAGLRNRVGTERLNFPILCVPFESLKDPKSWLANKSGFIPGSQLLEFRKADVPSVGIIREIFLGHSAHTFHGTEDIAVDADEGGGFAQMKTMLRVRKLSRRTDFLHAVSPDAEDPSNKFSYLDPEKCQADRIPAQWAHFAKLIPTVYHYVYIHWLADDLRTSLLQEAFPKEEQVPLVLAAISSSRARSTTDYQRLEFLGDTLLKFYVTLALVTNHPLWHEGYLSSAKEHMVSNSNLAAVAVRLRLSRYILNKPFTGAKWRPPYNEDVRNSDETKTDERKREMSQKVLADVVEAILGAAWIAGGEESLLICLRLFFPKVEWRPSRSSLELLRDRTPQVPVNEKYTAQLTELIGHKFQNPSLVLEAMTHASHTTASTPSYQRLEFLGDALLDLIVILRIWFTPTQLPERWMHRIRTATVNGPILSIAALSHHIEVHTTKPAQQTNHPFSDEQVTTGGADEEQAGFTSEVSKKTLISFLRANNTIGMRTAIDDITDRYAQWGPKVTERFETGKVYPWTELAAFNPPKFVSDLVESVVAAIVIDRGTLDILPESSEPSPVITFLNKLGLLTYLQRMLDDAETTDPGGPFNVWHPMEQIGSLAENDPVQYKILKTEPQVSKSSSQNSMEAFQTFDGCAESQEQTAQATSAPLRQCQLLVAGRVVCSVSGRSEAEVKTRAAETAVAILQKERKAGVGVKRKRDTAPATQLSSDSLSSDDFPPLPSSVSMNMPSQGDSLSSSQSLDSSEIFESPSKKIMGLHIRDTQDNESLETCPSLNDALLARTGSVGS